MIRPGTARFSAEDLTAMVPSPLSPVKMIDFLLVGHSQPSVPLSVLMPQANPSPRSAWLSRSPM